MVAQWDQFVQDLNVNQCAPCTLFSASKHGISFILCSPHTLHILVTFVGLTQLSQRDLLRVSAVFFMKPVHLMTEFYKFNFRQLCLHILFNSGPSFPSCISTINQYRTLNIYSGARNFQRMQSPGIQSQVDLGSNLGFLLFSWATLNQLLNFSSHMVLYEYFFTQSLSHV